MSNAFSFPYAPYPIQESLMSAIHDTITKKHIGVFESPTGTGKTLCVISAALTWLKHVQACDDAGDASEDDEAVEPSSTTVPTTASGAPSWLMSAGDRDRSMKSIEKAAAARERADRRKLAAERIARSVAAAAAGKGGALPLYDSAPTSARRSSGFDYETPAPGTKILFCSRTHSQLAQFVCELKKSPLSSGVRVVTLGSRSLLCVNDEVRGLGSDTAMNERCLELQDKSRGSTASTAGTASDDGSGEDVKPTRAATGAERKSKKGKTACSFHNHDIESMVADLSIATPMDIEDLGKLGKKHGGCPYYAARAAVADADIVLMPYTTLLHLSTRESYGFTPDVLQRCVVILDEGHNVIDAINGMHSCSVTLPQLDTSHTQLSAYLARYQSRMSAESVRCVTMLVTAVGSIKSFLGRCLATATATPDEGNVCTTPDFISTAKLTSIDIGAVTRYIANAGLSRKLRGFVPADTGGKPSTDVSVVASFNAVSSFLCSLLTTQDDGRVLFKPPSTDSAGVTRPPVLKFCLLNPGALFEPIVTHSRSVVLVGGTLQPMSGLLYQLFPSVLPSRTHTLACAHVVPPDNVLTVCLSVGPSGGTPFDFSFGTRDSIPQLTDLAAAIGNILMLSPIKAGVVCFFPSYELEAKAWLEWNASGSSERITGKARVFREPKGSADLAAVLDEYAYHISKDSIAAQGYKAFLSCVMGGKMSEGINFSDNLARMVIVVGMPYANVRDPELRARMDYLTSKASAVVTAVKDAPRCITGQEYYRDLCMKTVNQSIGRSIRHAKDWACIVLIDKRYDGVDVRDRLPKWITTTSPLVSNVPFGRASAAIAGFFKRHKPPTAASGALDPVSIGFFHNVHAT